MLGRLFGRVKPDLPPPAVPAIPSAIAAEPPTDKDRKRYTAIQELLADMDLAAVTTPSFRAALEDTTGTDDDRIMRVARHPDLPVVVGHIRSTNEARDAARKASIELFNALIDGFVTYQRQSFLPDDLAFLIENMDGDNVADFQRICAHPAAAEAARRYTALAAAGVHPDRAHLPGYETFEEHLTRIEREAFGNPNKLLQFEDTRPLNWEGIRYRCTAQYRRVAGTMNEREKFVYLVAYAWAWIFALKGQLSAEQMQSDFSHRMISAFGTGAQQWAMEASYTGDNEQMLLKAAKEYFVPEPVDQCFEDDAQRILKMHDQGNSNNLVVWAVAKLRPHSAGWATAR